jgi:hypothetical protein
MDFISFLANRLLAQDDPGAPIDKRLVREKK